MRVHNESETWQALTPDLGGRDLDAVSRLFRNHLLIGSGMPEHWFGGGGDANRATAAEMGDPAFKTLKVRSNGRVKTTWTPNSRARAETTAPRPPSPTPGLLRRRLLVSLQGVLTISTLPLNLDIHA